MAASALPLMRRLQTGVRVQVQFVPSAWSVECQWDKKIVEEKKSIR